MSRTASRLPSSNDGGRHISAGGFRAAGMAAALATSPSSGGGGAAATPRKLLKLLRGACHTLERHAGQLEPEVARALKELQRALHQVQSSSAASKLLHFLTEDVQLQRLQGLAAALQRELGGTSRLSSYSTPDFKADLQDVAAKLDGCSCCLPASQLALTEQFGSLAAELDPHARVPAALVQSALPLVQQAIQELHGPFWDAELLAQERAHLRTAAQQRVGSAGSSSAGSSSAGSSSSTVPSCLLEACLAQLAAAAGGGGSGEPGAAESGEAGAVEGADPFSLPAIGSMLRVVGEQPEPQPLQQQLTAAAAAPQHQQAQQQLEEFLRSCSSQSDRGSKLSTFQADMMLPPDTLDTLVRALEGTGRFVRVLRLPCHHLGLDSVQRLCAALQVRKSVRVLELPGCQLGDAGAAEVAALLAGGLPLRSLQLADNGISDAGAAALAQAVARAPCLQQLQLHGNAIGQAGCAALAATVRSSPQLATLTFRPGNTAATDADVRALAVAVVRKSGGVVRSVVRLATAGTSGRERH